MEVPSVAVTVSFRDRDGALGVYSELRGLAELSGRLEGMDAAESSALTGTLWKQLETLQAQLEVPALEPLAASLAACW